MTTQNFDPEPFIRAAQAGPYAVIEANSDRFPSWGRLKNRYLQQCDAVRNQGRAQLDGLVEVHNELSVAAAILTEGDPPVCKRLEYEESLQSTCSRFDFSADLTNDPRRNIEVKTIHPATQDDWARFERVRDACLIPKNVHVIISEEGLGGEFWHNWFAARSRMLEYTLDTENKILESGKVGEIFYLIFCGDGHKWRVKDLEDFVTFYKTGQHWPGDLFSKMELHDLNKRGITMARSVHHFGYFKRHPLFADPVRTVWRVPPMTSASFHRV